MLTKAKVATSSKAKNAKAVKKVAAPKTLAGKVAQGLSQEAAVNRDFGYVQAKNDASLNEQDYNTATAAQLANAQAAQTVADQNTTATTAQARQASGDDYAARGILRSGAQLNAQNQITGQDIAARGQSAQTVLDLAQQRQTGLLGLQQTDRDSVNKALQSATTNYYNTLKKAK